MIRFDRADGYWFEGYTHVMRAMADLILAHDFERSFDLSFRLFFPHSMPLSPLTEPLPAGNDDPFGFGIPREETRDIADVLTLLHTLDWPVVEPERRARIRTHLLEMIRLSRENWKAIRAENDDTNEWLPGPHQIQSPPLAGEPVTEAQVAAWHQTIDTFEAVLEGKLLLQHWRFPGRGINMKALLEGTSNLDFILMLTGPSYLPYLESGPVLDFRTFDAAADSFGPLGLFGTALWFN
jgi:hypothetical protein